MLAKCVSFIVLTAGMAAPHFTDCICFLEGVILGAHAKKFTVVFVANPTPQPGEEHGSVACDASCQSNGGQKCKVNGTMQITNNSAWTVVVN